MERVSFGIFTPPRGIGAIFRTAELAEAGPWDSVWVPDHLVGWGSKLDALDPWTLLGALAAKTKRVGLGIGVSDPHRRHPAIFAHQAMTLDQISGGRLLLGIGAGEAMNLAPYGIPYDKAVSRFEEFLPVVRSLWSQKMVTHKGAYYQLKNAPLAPKPASVKLYIAGNAPRTMALTARFGDGWLPFKRSPQVYRRDWEAIQAEARKGGRDPRAITPGLLLYIAVSKSRDEARKLALEQGRMLMAVSPRRLKEMGYEPPSARLDAHRLTPLTDPSVNPELPKAMSVPDRAIEESFVFGTPEECVEGIRKFADTGCRHFVMGLLNPGRERDAAMELCAKEVIPHFAEWAARSDRESI